MIAASQRRTALLAFGLAVLGACERRSSRPNIVLVSIDSLRADHLGCYGYARATSPVLDRLAAEGVLFEDHISSTSWTLPAHAALFTSLPDSIHGCTDTGYALAEGAMTLARRLREEGYATAGFYSGPYLHPAFGLDQGFETYEDCSSYPEMMARMRDASEKEEARINRASHADVTGRRIDAALERWFAHRPDRPFFLFVHLWDVHFDYIPPPPYDTAFDPDYRGDISGKDFLWDERIRAGMPERDLAHQVALYDGEIAWTDAVLGRLRERLERAGLLDGSIVAVTSDHGDEFFEHGGKAHRMTLYDEVLRVPLVLRYPRALPAGRRVAAQTRCIDVGPTLLELAGLDAPERVLGASLLPLLGTPGTPAAERPALSELYIGLVDQRSLRTKRFKFVDDLNAERQWFFDLVRDPKEAIPRADFESPLGAEARAAYAREMESLAAFARRTTKSGGVPGAPRQVPEGVLDQLQRLGYVQGTEEKR